MGAMIVVLFAVEGHPRALMYGFGIGTILVVIVMQVAVPIVAAAVFNTSLATSPNATSTCAIQLKRHFRV
jgi:hypothetical protein